MTHNQTPSDRTRSAILTYVSQSELRRAHNFATAAKPIEKLDLATTPTPWSKEPSQPEPALIEPSNNSRLSRQPSGDSAKASSQPPPLTQSHPGALAPTTVVETDFDIEVRSVAEDPPFQAPVSWLKPQQQELGESLFRFSRDWNWSERSTAGFLGFAAGMLVVVPIVLFLSLTTDQKPATTPLTDTDLAIASRLAPTKVTLASTTISAGTWFDSKNTEAPTTEKRRSPAIEVISQAHLALTEGRINQARRILRAAASPDTPRLWFMLAETYDPAVSIQSARNATTPSSLQVADTNFARFYYQQALAHGISEAQARLDGLTKQ